jgi:hypothetical protein
MPVSQPNNFSPADGNNSTDFYLSPLVYFQALKVVSFWGERNL